MDLSENQPESKETPKKYDNDRTQPANLTQPLKNQPIQAYKEILATLHSERPPMAWVQKAYAELNLHNKDYLLTRRSSSSQNTPSPKQRWAREQQPFQTDPADFVELQVRQEQFRDHDKQEAETKQRMGRLNT